MRKIIALLLLILFACTACVRSDAEPEETVPIDEMLKIRTWLLEEELEVHAVQVNVQAFVKVAVWMYHSWNQQQQAGHFAVISSIAGLRALGVAPGYSATKHFQAFYLKALRQLAVARRSKVHFTSIHPGFVDTDFIKGHQYPMTMSVDRAVACIIKGLDRRKNTLVVDRRWQMIAALMHLIPNGIWTRIGVFFRGSDQVFPHD